MINKMLNKKCNNCGKKVERKFDFCPWCGKTLKKNKYGMLGKDDRTELKRENELKLPFGFNKIFNTLIKQLEQEMGNLNNNPGNQNPKGIKIQFSTGFPQMQNPQEKKKEIPKQQISKEEKLRRETLEKVEATSKVKRIGDTILYEIDAPDVFSRKNISITELEKGLEIKAYAKTACYVKSIPLKAEIENILVRKDKIILEMKA
jgi:hypothetical protein